jgi:hypothetical protein
MGAYDEVVPYWFHESCDHRFDYSMRDDPLYNIQVAGGPEWNSKNARQLARLSLLRCGFVEDPDLDI